MQTQAPGSAGGCGTSRSVPQLLHRCAEADVSASNASPSSQRRQQQQQQALPPATRLSKSCADNLHLSDCADKLTGVAASVSWMLTPEAFAEMRSDREAVRNEPKAVRRYYKRQDSLIDAYDRIYTDIVLEDSGDTDRRDADYAAQREANICSLRLAQLSFFVNLLLTALKIVATLMSGSLSVVSSLVDSLIDLVSGVVVWYTNRQVRTRNVYYYPQGKTRLEPISIVILAVIMSTSTVQIIVKAMERIVQQASNQQRLTAINSSLCECANLTDLTLSGENGSRMSLPVFLMIGCVIIAKVILFALCYKFGTTSSTEALALDHRNDSLSNTVVLVMTVLSRYLWPYLDALGAIVISIYIIYSWVRTLRQQVRLLTGYTADPDFIKQVTFICVNHHRLVQQIDTVRAFHIGNNYLVEVDIVLPEDMSLKEAHDIGESLQQKLEKLANVERAFVHLDYEFSHDPFSEHKVV